MTESRLPTGSSPGDSISPAAHIATATAIVRDILRAPPDNPFDHIKNELIRRTTASEQRRLEQLLTTEDLGDRKPTDLLRRMHQLLGDRADRRLPNNIRMILPASEIASTEALARMADRIMEVNTPAIATLSSTTPSSNQAVDRLETQRRGSSCGGPKDPTDASKAKHRRQASVGLCTCESPLSMNTRAPYGSQSCAFDSTCRVPPSPLFAEIRSREEPYQVSCSKVDVAHAPAYVPRLLSPPRASNARRCYSPNSVTRGAGSTCHA
ncbi:hypothetical protein HPB47_025454 [Ixodes persulcatus]|uniref:Uncharacterized protein n=1 Tax=Ixodes persulcatus TaxID=34615 RepID=A0AC60Q1X5_IXOPE|nr:hypothetical protein HPB47_025454 [Ixodes persulcatus]